MNVLARVYACVLGNQVLWSGENGISKGGHQQLPPKSQDLMDFVLLTLSKYYLSILRTVTDFVLLIFPCYCPFHICSNFETAQGGIQHSALRLLIL